MRKISALFINELIKISQKFTILVMLGILLIGVFGFGYVVKMQESQITDADAGDIDETWIYSEMQTIVSMNQENVKALEDQINTASESDKTALMEMKAAQEDQVAMYQLAIAKKIPLLASTDYRVLTLQNILSLKSSLRTLLRIEEDDRSQEDTLSISRYNALIVRYEKLVDQQDFREYLNIKNDEIRADASQTIEEKQIALDTNELWYKIDPTGGISGDVRFTNIQSALVGVSTLRKSLLNNLDYQGSGSALPLAPDRRSTIENELAVLVYRLENGMSTDMQAQLPEEISIRGMLGFGTFMIVLMMMILAGSAVSQEISTGSIKSLIISPTRRWKIFTAKALSLLCVGLAVSFILYIAAMLANGLYFGFQSGAAYVYAANGVARALNFYIFQFAGLMVNFIDILVYMTLAFLLSITTRNTAAAVGISIAVYFGGNIANSFISIFAKGEWLKFIPFNNMGLSIKFFPFDRFAGLTNGLFGVRSNESVNPSLPFSLVYLAVLMVCMVFTALDSFDRRDI